MPTWDGAGEQASAQRSPGSVSPAGQHVLLGLRFQELSWDHTSPEEEESALWLEFDGDSEGTPVNKLLKVYSKQVVVGAACAGAGDGTQGPQAIGGSRLGGLLRAWGPGGRLLLTGSHPCGFGRPGQLAGQLPSGQWLVEGCPVLCDQPALAPSVLEPPVSRALR